MVSFHSLLIFVFIFCWSSEGYLRIEKSTVNVHATNVLTVKFTMTFLEDVGSSLYSLETEYFVDVFDVEERFTVFIQGSPTDNLRTNQIFAFKHNVCDLGQGTGVKDNLLTRVLVINQQKFIAKCPFLRGSKFAVINKTINDSFFPPVPLEVLGRLHREMFGKLNGSTKWKKLYSHDVFFRVKK